VGSWLVFSVFRRAHWRLEIAVVMGGCAEDVEMEGCERWERGRAKVWRLSEGRDVGGETCVWWCLRQTVGKGEWHAQFYEGVGSSGVATDVHVEGRKGEGAEVGCAMRGVNGESSYGVISLYNAGGVWCIHALFVGGEMWHYVTCVLAHTGGVGS
jgi:hypothetical protein